MDIIESWDIDTEEDFQIAELILRQRKTTHLHSNPNINSNLLEYLNTELRPLMSQVNQQASTTPTILISAPYMMQEIETFRYFYQQLNIKTIIAPVEERLSEQDLAQYHQQYQVALIGDDAFSADILKKSGVKALCKWGTGIDSIDIESCRDLNIPIYNTPNAFSVPVSQSIMAAILGFARQTFHSNSEMKHSNRWVKFPAKTLEEMTIGIVGLGNIGRHVARLLNDFHAKVVGYDILNPHQLPSIPYLTQTESITDLLKQSDIVCLCCTLNPTSYHLINHKTIYQLKKGAYLINMARGPLIQESALVEAIQDQHLAGAALDVFEVEPLPESSQLRRLPNVIISSHNSNSSPKYWRNVHLNTIRNSLKALLSHQS
jgi:D-3-phosphoglycerate dehydrogenase